MIISLIQIHSVFIYFMFLSDEGPTLETSLHFTIHVDNTPTFLYFNLYLNNAYEH